METKPVEVEEEIFTPDQEREILDNELKLIPAADRKEIEKVLTSADIILIGKHKQQLKKFKDRFKKSKFTFIDGAPLDKKTYDKALEAWREVKNYRTQKVVPDFKVIKDPLNKVLSFYNGEQKPLEAGLKEVEAIPGDYCEKYEKAEKDEKDREARENEIRTNNRVDELIKAGATFDQEYYSAGSEELGIPMITVGMVNINSVDDIMWENIMGQVKNAVALVNVKQAEKDEAERKKKEKEDSDNQKLRDQALKVRGKELKFLELELNEAGTTYLGHGITISKKEVEDMDIDAWQLWVDDAETKVELEKKRAAFKTLMELRGKQLHILGFVLNTNTDSFDYDDITIGIKSKIYEYNTEQWQSLIEEIQPQVEAKKQEKEDARIATEKQNEIKQLREKELSPYWQFVVNDEKNFLGKMNDDGYTALLERIKASHSQKIKDDAAEQIRKDNQSKQERLAAEGDEAIYNDFLERLKAVTIPEVNTKDFKTKIATIANFINGLK